jgi:hypothetical protein
MRRRFNRGRYYERTLEGSLSANIERNTHPSRTEASEPFCTHTQAVSYLDTNQQEVARVHQYLRPDGLIGASGRPDPKRILENGIMYRLRKPPANIYEKATYFLSDFRDRVYWFIGLEVD